MTLWEGLAVAWSIWLMTALSAWLGWTAWARTLQLRRLDERERLKILRASDNLEAVLTGAFAEGHRDAPAEPAQAASEDAIRQRAARRAAARG
jgi:hypothetical protein